MQNLVLWLESGDKVTELRLGSELNSSRHTLTYRLLMLSKCEELWSHEMSASLSRELTHVKASMPLLVAVDTSIHSLSLLVWIFRSFYNVCVCYSPTNDIVELMHVCIISLVVYTEATRTEPIGPTP